MVYYQRIPLIAALMLGFFYYCSATAEITVEPFGFAISVEEDGEAEIELTLSNSSEEEVAFSIKYELVTEEDERRAGPRRDDLGDILAEYDVPYNESIGLAWDDDNGWMWGHDYCAYGNNGRLYAINPDDGEVMENFEIIRRLIGLCYLEGVLYVAGYTEHPETIYRFDTEGNALDDMEAPINMAYTYIATDGEHLFTNRHTHGEAWFDNCLVFRSCRSLRRSRIGTTATRFR